MALHQVRYNGRAKKSKSSTRLKECLVSGIRGRLTNCLEQRVAPTETKSLPILEAPAGPVETIPTDALVRHVIGNVDQEMRSENKLYGMDGNLVGCGALSDLNSFRNGG